VVLQFSSAATFPDIFEYAKNNNHDIELIPCRSPRYVTINAVLPEKMLEFQHWAQQQSRQYPEIDYLKSLAGLLDQYQFDPELNHNCKQYLATIDSIRQNHYQPVQDLIGD
jgi:hypothetical protein